MDGPLKRATILVADDEKEIVETMRLFLESNNYSVIRASTGSQAITKAHENMPDLILLDIMFRDMTGYDICLALRKDPSTSSIPIIMISGLDKESDRILGMDFGADDYITKPFNLNELKTKIQTVLESGEKKIR